jgi:hypothetical protein
LPGQQGSSGGPGGTAADHNDVRLVGGEILHWY